MRKGDKKTVVICTSASFYKEAVEVKNQLLKLDVDVKVPLTLNKMVKNKDFRVERYKTWYKNPSEYKKKSFLTRHHFNKIVNGDAVLVLNYTKNGKSGYIGGAVLNEMAIAFYTKKPIYILNPIDETSSYKEEILAMQPIILKGDISKIL